METRNQQILHPLERVGRRATQLAEVNRNEFAEYYCGNGEVPWQTQLA